MESQALNQQVSTIVNQLKSADNNLRKEAESQITSMRASSARALFEGLVGMVSSAEIQDDGVKALACLLLKKYFLDDRAEEKELEQLQAADYQNLVTHFTQNMNLAEPMNLLRRKAEVLVKCHKKNNSFEALLQQLEQMATAPTSEDATVIAGKEVAMYMFEMLIEFNLTTEQCIAKQESFMTMFSTCLQDTQPKVRSATLKAMTNFLVMLSDEELVLKYSGNMAGLLDIVIEVIKTDETQGQESLESLIELTSQYGSIWKDSTPKLIYLCSEVMKNKDFEDNTRQSAMEVIASMSEVSAKLLKDNIEDMKTHFYPALAILMTNLEHEDDIDAWMKIEQEDIIVANDSASKAGETLERLSENLGAKMTLACCTQMIAELVKHENWQCRHAGYVAVGMISETCAKAFKSDLENLLKMISPGILDAHPRVRYQALAALSLLLNDQSPHMQFQYHEQLMPVLMDRMDKEDQIKMKTQAVSAVANFVRTLLGGEEVDLTDAQKEKAQQIISNYSQALFNAISVLFQMSIQQSYAPLQEETLILLSCMAETMTDLFTQHYATFMPGLKEILKNTPFETKEQKDLRANCIQTIGSIFDSMKNQRDVCGQDALEVMQLLLPLMEDGKLDASDPQKIAIQAILGEVAGVLKDDFLQFMQPIMQSLITDIEADVAIKWVKQDDAAQEDEEDDQGGAIQKMLLKVKGMEGDVKISINTAALENKLSALNILRSLAQQLGKSFGSYIDVCANLIASKMVHDKSSSGVRKEATKTMSVLLGCCDDQQKMVDLLHLFLPEVATEISEKVQREDYIQVKWLTQEMSRVFKHFYNCRGLPILSDASVSHVVEMFGKLLTAIKGYRDEKMQAFESKKGKLTEEDIDDVMDYVKKVDRIWSHVMEMCSVLHRTMPNVVSPLIKTHLTPLFGAQLLDIDNKQDYQLINALCFLDDCLEYGDADLFALVNTQALPKLLEIIQKRGEANTDIMQNCIFGMGLVAQRSPADQFGEQLQSILQTIQWMYGLNLTNDEGKQAECVDNAVSTLGKCIYFQGAGVPAEVVKQGFLGKLPITSDTEEAQVTHALLCSQVIAQNVHLAAHQEDVKQALIRIRDYDAQNPGDEILNDEGKAQLSQILGQ